MELKILHGRPFRRNERGWGRLSKDEDQKGRKRNWGKNIVEILAFYSINGVFVRLGDRNKIF